MMHNVNTAVQQADTLLVIVDATSNLAEVVDMPGMAKGWEGPPAALVIHAAPFLCDDFARERRGRRHARLGVQLGRAPCSAGAAS